MVAPRAVDPVNPVDPVSGDTITWGGSHGIVVSSDETFSGGIIPTGGLPDPALNIGGTAKLTLDSGVFDNQGSANTIIKGVAGSEFVIAAGEYRANGSAAVVTQRFAAGSTCTVDDFVTAGAGANSIVPSASSQCNTSCRDTAESS